MENPTKMEYLEVSLFLVQHPNGSFPSSYVFGAYVFLKNGSGHPKMEVGILSMVFRVRLETPKYPNFSSHNSENYIELRSILLIGTNPRS